MTFVESFTPTSDITAYELALGMNMMRAYFIQASILIEDFNALPPGVRRHFVVRDLNAVIAEGGGDPT